MGLVEDRQDALSQNIRCFKENIGEFVRMKLSDNHIIVAEPVEIKEKKFFFKLVGGGWDNHPLASHPIENVEEITPL